jgi:hypothetical protein
MMTPERIMYVLGVAFACWALGSIAIERHRELGQLLRAFVEDQKARARLLARARALRKQQDKLEKMKSSSVEKVKS